ncbi:MAG: tetratricopeptide repeat protein [Symploca sp. SIO1C2]|nr:tetratricopeptide repeat protein [Symploca sp. SIO1C2]
MPYRLKKFLSLFLTTSLLCLGSHLLPTVSSIPTAQILAQAQATQDRADEAQRLYQTGVEQLNRGQFGEALETFKQVLVIFQEIGNRVEEGNTLNNLGAVYSKLGKYQQALNYFQQSLAISQKIGARSVQGATLNNLGEVYRNLGKYQQALDKFQQALAIAQELGIRAGEGSTFNNLGLVYHELGQYQQALDYYQQALVIQQEIGARSVQGATLNNLGEVYRNQGKYQQALYYYQQALAISQALGNRLAEKTTLNNLGAIHHNLGQYQQALDYYQPALAIAQEIGDSLGEGTTLNNLGEVYRNQGKYQQALDLYQQALVIHQEVGARAEEGTTLNNLGSVYYNQGQYQQALDKFQQALTLSQEIGDRSGEGRTLNNLGLVYDNLGKYQQALDYFQQALVIHQEIGDRAAEGRILNNLGLVDYNQGKYQQALDKFQQALAIIQEVGDLALEGVTLNNLGLVYKNLGKYQQALDYYQRTLVILQEIGDRAGEGSALNNLGTIHRKQGKYQQALGYFQQALAISQEIGAHAAEGSALNNLGFIYYDLNQYTNAEKYGFAAIEVLESLRFGLRDTDKVAILETQASSYLGLQRTLVTQNKYNTALEISERGRARAFIELLAQRLSPKTTEQITIKPPTLKQIQQIASQQNATLVEYSLVADQLYIWVIPPTGKIAFRSIELNSLEQSLADLVQTSRESMGIRGRASIGVESKLGVDQTKRLQQLYNLLIQPIAELLPTNPDAQVIFIPHQELFLVPFPALQDESGNYLIDQHTILTAPSIQVLELTRKQRAKAKGEELLIVGNPTMPSISLKFGEQPQPLSNLPGAQQEAIAIAKLFNTEALIGSQATETTVKSQSSNASIIHLATHGLLDYGPIQGKVRLDIPGALALAPSNQDDGLLTAGEILDLELKAKLVVLSACDTGRGEITSDGVIGLSRSLINAGTPSIIVSLWKVPDAPTRDLMQEFYQQWQQGGNKAQALRQAMLKIKQQDSNPKNWAAFTLIGEAE